MGVWVTVRARAFYRLFARDLLGKSRCRGKRTTTVDVGFRSAKVLMAVSWSNIEPNQLRSRVCTQLAGTRQLSDIFRRGKVYMEDDIQDCGQENSESKVKEWSRG